jgi:hypothetical protein
MHSRRLEGPRNPTIDDSKWVEEFNNMDWQTAEARIGGRHTNRQSQRLNALSFNVFIQVGGERFVPIVQQNLVVLIRKALPGALARSTPQSDVRPGEVNQPSESDLERDKNINDGKPTVALTKNSQETIACAWLWRRVTTGKRRMSLMVDLLLRTGGELPHFPGLRPG